MKKSPRLQDMPIALTGLALGVAGITGAWSNLTHHYVISVIGACIASYLVAIIIVKYILYPKKFIQEISCPLLGSVIPTLDMALMIIASVIVKFAPLLGQIIWLFAVLIHGIFLFEFIRYRAKDFQLEHMVPSWFVPPIGIVVACVSGSEMGFDSLTVFLFYFGLIFYIIILPVMLYRIMFGNKITDHKLPAFAIMGAPANLCLAGYLVAFQSPDYFIATSLAYLGIFTTSLVYISFIRIFRIPFSPLYASFTFPLGIGATAILKYTDYLATLSFPFRLYIHIWQWIGYVELSIATIIIVYVFIKMKMFVWKNIIKLPIHTK